MNIFFYYFASIQIEFNDIIYGCVVLDCVPPI